jgi:NAD(P)-dependent dehydrogenase (short-subunit alcohol dehydrogenase family)
MAADLPPGLAGAAGPEELTGKAIVVTGAGSTDAGHGTGSAMALLFARHGAHVCVMDRDGERAEATSALIEQAGGSAFTFEGDVTDAAACEGVATETRSRWGRIDGLVNNVGIPGGGRVLDTDPETWDRVMEVNVKGAVLMCQAILPVLIAQRAGAILNIASVAGLFPNGVAAYSSSKAALISLTRELAVGYGRDGVRANVLCPGHILAPLSRERPPDVLERRRRAGPLNIEGTVWDVAWAALFLMSDRARFITAAVLPVDGGVTAVPPLTAFQFLG